MTASEKNTRKKIRISIIDVLIVLAVIAGIGGTFVHYRIYEKNNAVVTDDKATVSVLLSSVPKEEADRIALGERVFYGDNVVFGTVVEVSTENATVYYTNEDGRIAETTDGELSDVTLLIEVKGGFTSDGFFANGTSHTAAGMEIELFTPRFSGKGLIFDVKKQA